MSDSLANSESKRFCAFDSQHNIWIHRFGPGACRCRCGQRVIRKPQKKEKLKFGRGSGEDFEIF